MQCKYQANHVGRRKHSYLLLRIILIIRSHVYGILRITRKKQPCCDEIPLLIIGSPTMPDSLLISPDAMFTAYQNWLPYQPLAANTKRTYRTRVHQYCTFLTTRKQEYGDPLADSYARDYAVRDYKLWLKTQRHAQPSSVNLSLAAIDHFYNFLHLTKPAVKREDLIKQSPRGLSPEEQVRFLRAVERCASSRDRALAHLFFYTALRLHEVAALTIDDVRISARKGVAIVRSGKGDTYREVPLNQDARDTLRLWLDERAHTFGETAHIAVFLSRKGQPLAERSMDYLLRRLATDAGLECSAHTLRHTCLTNLVRSGNDIVLVAEIAGHKRLETTRRYTLPSQADREQAMERLRVEY
jgi:site-specific recombinase XerD